MNHEPGFSVLPCPTVNFKMRGTLSANRPDAGHAPSALPRVFYDAKLSVLNLERSPTMRQPGQSSPMESHSKAISQDLDAQVSISRYQGCDDTLALSLLLTIHPGCGDCGIVITGHVLPKVLKLLHCPPHPLAGIVCWNRHSTGNGVRVVDKNGLQERLTEEPCKKIVGSWNLRIVLGCFFANLFVAHFFVTHF